jgi:hypothetical protein
MEMYSIRIVSVVALIIKDRREEIITEERG